MQLNSPAWWLIRDLKRGYGGWLEQNRGDGNPGKWALRACGRWCPHPLVPWSGGRRCGGRVRVKQRAHSLLVPGSLPSLPHLSSGCLLPDALVPWEGRWAP